MKYHNECINEKEKASSCFFDGLLLEIKSITFIMLHLYQPEVF